MENLLINSFPEDEYRDLQELRDYTDNSPIFFWNIIYADKKPVGLVSYWNLDSFYYIEHFAIDPAQRNGGFGKKLLEKLSNKLDGSIVLEVETPTEEMAERRIAFYKRQGFALWEKEYMQPPYKKGENGLPMFLMVKGNLDMEKDFDRIKQSIYRHVYNVTF